MGRHTELSQFRGTLNSCIEEGLGHTVYIRGEAGIGKTRLVEEFARIATESGPLCCVIEDLSFPSELARARMRFAPF